MALISKPILGPIDENIDIYLTVDSSKLGLAAIYFKNDRMARYIPVLILRAQRQKLCRIGRHMLRDAGISYDFYPPTHGRAPLSITVNHSGARPSPSPSLSPRVRAGAGVRVGLGLG